MAPHFGKMYMRTSLEKWPAGSVPLFGYVPFDHFIVEKWNPESPLSRELQKEKLVREYITLGSYHRRPYIDAPGILGHFTNIPDTIPTDLYTPLQRSLNEWMSRVFWIRTWYGNAETSEAEADTQYNALGEKAFNELSEIMDIDEQFVFEDKNKFKAETADLRAFQAPEFVLKALCHCPDRISGGLPSLVGEYDEFGRMLFAGEVAEEADDVRKRFADVTDVDRCQVLLVLVADQKACVEGKVLGIGINHRGQMLPGRVRRKANEAYQMIANWDDGQQLSECFHNDLVDEEVDEHEGIDGWS